MLNTTKSEAEQIKKVQTIPLKYFFNQFDEKDFFEYITESLISFLENSTDKENGENFTFLRDAKATIETIRDDFVIQTTWIKSKENKLSIFCFSPDGQQSNTDNAKKYTTEDLVNAISEKYKISKENALLIVKFRGQHLRHNCLIGTSVYLLEGAEREIYPTTHFPEPNSLSCIDFYREDQSGNLIYESFLISLSKLKTQRDIDELIERLASGDAIKANDPHVISQQSFKMTYVNGQEIPKLSDYQRFDTQLFEDRRKKLIDYSDCYNPQFKQYLENICRRPVSLPSDREQTIQTFTDLLTDRLNNIESPAELINIFKDFPPDADLLTHTTNIQDALALKDETLKRKYITKNLTEILDRIVTKITPAQLNDIRNNLNKYCEDKLNDFDDKDVKNAILFSYFYHIVIQNIIKACPTINGHEKNKLYSAAKDIFNRKIMSASLPTVEYFKKAANCIVPTEDENCTTFAGSANANKLNTKTSNFFNGLNRIFNYFPAQKDFKSELEQFNKIIEKANAGNSLSADDKETLELELNSYLKENKSTLPIYWQKTIIEVKNFIIQMQMHARNNFLDVLGNIRKEIKTVLETTYGCDIDSWIGEHGKDKVYNALFNSYFSNIYAIEFKAALNKKYSNDKNEFLLVQWIFNKLSGEDYTDITRPVPHLQKLSESTSRMINDEFKSVNKTDELTSLNQDFENNLNRIKSSGAADQTAYKKALLNYSGSLYQAQLSWQNKNQKAEEEKYDFLIESAQQQQGHIQNLLFLTEQPRVINDLVSVLNLTQELPLFYNAESVIDMAKINIKQKKSDMISEIKEMGKGLTEKSLLANEIENMFGIDETNKYLRIIWSATKEKKPSLFMACFNSTMRGLGIYDKNVNGLAEWEYLTEVKKKIKGFLINSEFEQNIINVIDHFCSGKISQNEVVPAIKLIIKRYEPHLLGRIERLNAFCDSFSSLIKEHKKLYEVKEVPILENAVEEEPTIQPNQKPDPDSNMAKLREINRSNVQAINEKHSYSSRFWRAPGPLMDAPPRSKTVADIPAAKVRLII